LKGLSIYFFIERDELDIYDIPISKITDDFLSYLNELEKMNIEVASEFILVAATLMRIKAKMLLPRPQLDDEGNELDPREELIKHLLEYKKYKSVIKELAEMEDARALMNKRGNIVKELRSLAETTNVDAELQDLDLYKLLKVFGKVIKRFENEQQKPTHTVVPYPYTIDGQKKSIMQLLSQSKKVAFTEVILKNNDKIGVIFNFLAILDLLQLGMLTIRLGEGFNNFWIESLEGVIENA